MILFVSFVAQVVVIALEGHARPSDSVAHAVIILEDTHGTYVNQLIIGIVLILHVEAIVQVSDAVIGYRS